MKYFMNLFLSLSAIFNLFPVRTRAELLEPQSEPIPRLSDIALSAYKSKDPRIEAMYEAGLKNLDSQFYPTEDGTVYVSTGDIPAEWLRDSSVQVRPYLFFAKDNLQVRRLIKAVVLRQVRYLAINPYANAFKKDYTIWEDKFELDSLSYPIILAWTYWKITGDASIFTPEAQKGFDAALKTLILEQNHTQNSKYSRKDLSKNPFGVTGMVWSGYRPSDDPNTYAYLIPGQMMVVQSLTALAEIQTKFFNDKTGAQKSLKLQKEIIAALNKYAVVKTEKYGSILAYEVDGLGKVNLMDDGNLPSLLGMPLLGIVDQNHPIYLNTRRFILSNDNPFYYSGKLGAGVGSPHTPKGMVWPLAILSQAFTAQSATEQQQAVEFLLNSDPGDHLLHESFDPNNPKKLTRKDFGWPNAMFIEFILTRMAGYPELPKPPKPNGFLVGF